VLDYDSIRIDVSCYILKQCTVYCTFLTSNQLQMIVVLLQTFIRMSIARTKNKARTSTKTSL